MEKKYYDLIIDLIKEHRKFPGCESIIEDIAEDVYSHSKVVIGSITNEEVLISYFKKVISTSIVTVPKKLNINTRVSRTSSALPDILETIQNEENTTLIENNNTVLENENALVIEEDNLAESLPCEDIDACEEQLNSETLEEFVDDFANATAAAEEEEEEEEELIVEQTEVLVEDIVEQPSEPIDKVNKTLVDKMINGVETKEHKESQEEILSSVIEETPLEENLLEATEEVIEELDFEPLEETEEYSIEDSNEDILYQEDNIEEVETLEEDEEDDDEVNTENFEANENEQDTLTEIVIEETSEALETIEDSECEYVLDSDDEIESFELTDDRKIEEADEELSIEDNFELDEAEELESLEPIEAISTVMEEEPAIVNDTISNVAEEFTPPMYTCFNYEPDVPEYDITEIFSDLEKISDKHPEKRILEVCDLKYNKNLSVLEIAKTLNFSEEDVIIILNEIVETVKD